MKTKFLQRKTRLKGYSALYRESRLDDPALDLILKCHEPIPALAVDQRWNLVAANRMVPLLLFGVDPQLLLTPHQRRAAGWGNYLPCTHEGVLLQIISSEAIYLLFHFAFRALDRPNQS